MENLSAKSIVTKIRNKEISSREVTEYFIGKIEEVNLTINAVIVKRYEDALNEADEADRKIASGESVGRLHGLPMTIKECFDLAGTPSTLGVMRRKNDIPATNDPYVQKIIDEGAVILGKTNVPQLLSFYESENPVYGVTKNPHDLKRAPGGSSGGEGAIIAAGGSPLGIGSDIGGSLRSPAHFCGITSIKPTMWRIPDYTRFIDPPPEGPITPVSGPMGRHVEDIELLLGIMNESEMATRPDIPPLGKMNEVDISKLNVGYFLSDGVFEPMPAIKRGVMEAVEKLRASGANVFEWALPDPEQAEALFFKTVSADGANTFKILLGDEKPVPQIAALLRLANTPAFIKSLLPGLLGLLGQKRLKQLIPFVGGEFHQLINSDIEQYRRDFAKAMENAGIDAILGPPCALPAYLHRTADKVGLGGTYMMIYNLLGYPAGIVPVSKITPEEAIGRKKTLDLTIRTASSIEASSAGLPLTVQIAAKPWNEHIVLALMKTIE